MTELTAMQDFQIDIWSGNKDRGFHTEGDEVREELVEAQATGDPEKIRKAKRNLRNYYSNRITLIIGEIIEAHEELRKGHGVAHEYTSVDVPVGLIAEVGDYATARQAYLDHGGYEKLEGPAVELADAAIRLFDFFEEIGVDLEDVMRRKLLVNEKRGYRHGGKDF